MAYQYKLTWEKVPDNMVEGEEYKGCRRTDYEAFKEVAHKHFKDTVNKMDRDYFQSVQDEYGVKAPSSTDPSLKINETVNSLHDLLQYKNQRYGSSGLEPINVLSKTDAVTGLLQRADDKIARIKNSPTLRKNDVADLIGYLVLICVSMGWTNFDEFKD